MKVRSPKINMSTGLCSFWGRESASLPFPASIGYLHSLPCGPFLYLPGQQHLQISLCLTSASIVTSPFLTQTYLPPSYKDACDYIGPLG